MSWTALSILAIGAYGFKLAGVMFGVRLDTPPLQHSILLLPAALFAAVIALQTFERDTALVIDARVVGLVVAVGATWKKVPFLGVIVLAMMSTAVTRALF